MRHLLHAFGIHWWAYYDEIDKETLFAYRHRRCVLCEKTQIMVVSCAAPMGGGVGWVDV